MESCDILKYLFGIVNDTFIFRRRGVRFIFLKALIWDTSLYPFPSEVVISRLGGVLVFKVLL